MKRAIIIFLAVLFTGLTGQMKAGDPMEVDPFHSIEVSSEIEAEILLSETENIVADFNNADEGSMIIEVVDSVLKVRMKTGTYKDASLKIRINYVNQLRMLKADGRAQIWNAREIHLDNELQVRLNNGGEMRLILFCDSLNAALSQGSIIHLKGKTRALSVKAGTNATFSGYEFESEVAEVYANTTGKAKVWVNKYLNANAATKGFIGYVGEPGRVDEKTSMKGEIVKTLPE